MKYSFVLLLVNLIIFSGCNHVTFRRHINANLNDSKSINKGGTFDEQFAISTAEIINAISKNINTKDNSGSIEKLEIETINLKINLLPNNTATLIRNVKFILEKTNSTLLKFDDSGKFVNSATVFALNKFIDTKIALGFKDDLIKNLATNKPETFFIKVSGAFPAGEFFRGTISLEFKASMDVVTCELIPFGLGPSDCF